MAGSIAGGKLAAKTNKEQYGEDYYKVIGAKGGKLGKTGGFGQGEIGRERARKWGVVGGRKSRRKTNAESR